METDVVERVTTPSVLLTFRPDDDVPGASTFLAFGADDLTTGLERLGLPVGDETTFPSIARGDDGGLVPVDHTARELALLPTLRVLASLHAEDQPGWSRPSEAVIAWSQAAKLALEHVVAGRIVPLLRPLDHGESAVAYWRCLPLDDGRLDALAARFPPVAHAIRTPGGDSIVSARALLLRFFDAVADSCARAGRRPDLIARRPRVQRPWSEAWPLALHGDDPVVIRQRVRTDELAEAVDEWAAPLLGDDRQAAGHLAIRLVPPEVESLSQRVDHPWTLELLLQVGRAADAVLPAAEVWQASRPIERDGQRVQNPQEALVRALAHAARIYPPLDAVLSDAAPTSLTLGPAQAAELIRDASTIAEAGVNVLLPAELQGIEERRLRVRVRLGSEGGTADPGEFDKSATGVFTATRLADFRFEIALGDDQLSQEEFEALVALDQPLVQWKGEWVRIEPAEIEQLADLDGEGGTLGVGEALVAALSGRYELDGFGLVDAVADGEIAAMVDRIRHADEPGDAVVRGITGELRPYQRRGVAWMQRLAELGLGAVLADDMGLGKTLQAIALITSRPRKRPHLVVCPTSVVGNWEREINRFAPDVEVIRYHGADRPERVDAFRRGTVAVTSYALLRRDVDLLASVDWDVVVYDEAQQVKNVASKGARAARVVPAQVRVAMTGTPLENRLSELWAIIDLTNPGLLGPLRRFTEQFAVPIERWRDQDAAGRLRRLVAPFIMRRLKTDPAIAPELPEKQEIDVVCSLTREQAALYQAAVDDAFQGGRLAATDGIARRGRILALLTALKQICNHPAQFLSEDGPIRGRSGKLERTVEILGEILANDDRALVFTQYRVMGDILSRHLAERLELPEAVPFLHGGVTLPRRDEMVARYQDDPDGPPILLVSLRAGGTGLNLTRATEVIHFDRWWNPAVEDQATDRTHRIGQTRKVTVHSLVAAGTVEDRIAELLVRKRELADAVVGSGEAWITELGEEELYDLVRLSTDNVADEDDDA